MQLILTVIRAEINCLYGIASQLIEISTVDNLVQKYKIFIFDQFVAWKKKKNSLPPGPIETPR